MPFPIEEKLVVGITTTALFDLSVEDQIFREQGLDAFKAYQKAMKDSPPPPGSAFSFIKRLLHLNKLFPDHSPVEVILMSRNDPSASIRMHSALKVWDLDITRSFFLSGASPYKYMKSINACLYLSTDKIEVKEAVANGYPAGYILPCVSNIDESDTQLRVAFDFDGVLVDDEAETVFKTEGLPLFHHHELTHKDKPLNNGPLMPLMQRLSAIQKLEKTGAAKLNHADKAVRISIVTARNAPSHERIITTLESLGIEADELFLMGGIQKKNILDELKPQIFFDDQLGHLEPAAESTPCVHIPFGITNQE